MSVKKIDFSALKADMPYKWKPNNTVGKRMNCVAYVDSRQVQDKLDKVCGPENWQDDYKVINNNMYAGVGINVTGDPQNPTWIWKWDCGTESNTEREKGESSDAFKRAAVKWGVGRFLYSLDMYLLDQTDYKGKLKPCTKDGKILWSGDDITDYINSVRKGSSYMSTPSTPPVDNHKPTPERYNKNKGGDNTPYAKSPYTQETISKVKSLSRDGKTGKDVLIAYIPQFNKKNKTSYKELKEFATDLLINKLISFVEDTPPAKVG